MDFLSFVLCLILAYIAINILSNARKKYSDTNIRKLPPTIPIISNLIYLFGLLGTKPHVIFAKLAKKYGPLMAIKVGTLQTVIISSAAMAKEALQKNDLSFCNRRVIDAVRVGNHHESSLVWLPSSSPIWRNLRKLCNSQVFSTSRLNASNELRKRKVNDLLCHVRECSEADVAVDIGHAVFTTTLNLLLATFFGVDMGDPSAEVALRISKVIKGGLESAGKINLADMFPILKKFDPQGIRRRAAVHFKKMIDIFKSLIDERLQEKRSSELKQDGDVLDALLGINQEKTEEIETSCIPNLLVDLFAAGTDTTATTIEWAMAELLRNPEIMKKTQLELRETIGLGNSVQESDITRLPYLQAVVKETIRLHPPLALVPRSVDSDIKLFEFTVPKNAAVIVNIYAIGRDPDIWERPNSFDPKRFLGSKIDYKGRDFEFIPFGTGRRICPGLPLAVRMLHLMLGSLLHEYDWKVEGGGSLEMINMEDKLCTVLERAQKLRVIPVPVRV